MALDTTSYVEALAAWLPHCRWFSAKNLRDINMQRIRLNALTTSAYR